MKRQAGNPGAFNNLFAEGACTLEARTLLEETHTLPNHTGMLTGAPVSSSTGTRVTFNVDNGSTLERTAGRYVPGVFDVVHDHGLTTALLAEKDKFDFLVRSWDAEHGAADTTGADDGRDKVDTAEVASSAALVSTLTGLLGRGRSGLYFLHVAAPDAEGHAHGFLSPGYQDGVAAADRQVEAVLNTIRAEPDLTKRTTVILTADHGGAGPDHNDPKARANYRIPFCAWGRSVPQGDLYAMNPDRVAPGVSQPAYGSAPPIRNLDAANLALDLLRLPLLQTDYTRAIGTLQVR